MPRTFHPQNKEQNAPSFLELWQPVKNIFVDVPPLEARGKTAKELRLVGYRIDNTVKVIMKT